MPPSAFCAGPRRPPQEATSISSRLSFTVLRRLRFLVLHLTCTGRAQTALRFARRLPPRIILPNRLNRGSDVPLRSPRPRGAGVSAAKVAYPPLLLRVPATNLITSLAEHSVTPLFYTYLLLLVSRPGPPKGIQAAAPPSECPTDPLAGATRGPPLILHGGSTLCPSSPEDVVHRPGEPPLSVCRWGVRGKSHNSL